MERRIFRLLIDEHVTVFPVRNGALDYFKKVLSAARQTASPEHIAAKSRLDFFCGHIDEMRGLRSFVPVNIVAAHYSALHPACSGEPGFLPDLAAYLSLLNVEFNGQHEFRGALVALTFDRARHAQNILRFLDDGQARVRVKAPSPHLQRGR